MKRVQVRHFLSSDGTAAGRIMISESTVNIEVSGLVPQDEYEVITCFRQSEISESKTIRADEQGRISAVIGRVENEDTFYLIIRKMKLILFDSDITPSMARGIIWQNKNQGTQREKRIFSSKIQKKGVTDDIISTGEIGHTSVTFRMASGNDIHFLPEVIWPKEAKEEMLHFLRGKAEKLSILSANTFNWRFVKTQALAGDIECNCILGRYLKEDMVTAIAILIDEKQLPDDATMPGFQYQKSPDGRGFWIHIQEFKASV